MACVLNMSEKEFSWKILRKEQETCGLGLNAGNRH